MFHNVFPKISEVFLKIPNYVSSRITAQFYALFQSRNQQKQYSQKENKKKADGSQVQFTWKPLEGCYMC